MPPLARDSEFPPAVDAVRPKTLGRASGTFAAVQKPLPQPFARKPFLEKYDPVGLREDRHIAVALAAAMSEFGMNNCALARILGISESIVRGILVRQRPLGARHLLKLEAEAPEFHAALLFLARQVLGASANNDNGAG